MFKLNFEFNSFSPMFSVKHEPINKIASWWVMLIADFFAGVLRKKFILLVKLFLADFTDLHRSYLRELVKSARAKSLFPKNPIFWI